MGNSIETKKSEATMRGKYLNPKADMTFKLVFGEHPDLVMSLLNALLPLPDDGQIESVEYLTPEMVPDNPAKKDSIVDVRCKDQQGRQFIVEMQLYWNEEFKRRVLLNASKAIVRQLDKFWPMQKPRILSKSAADLGSWTWATKWGFDCW